MQCNDNDQTHEVQLPENGIELTTFKQIWMWNDCKDKLKYQHVLLKSALKIELQLFSTPEACMLTRSFYLNKKKEWGNCYSPGLLLF